MTRRHPSLVEEFDRDVRKHRMTILRDDGVYRHVRFQEKGTYTYWFEIVTWRGVLVINGDCGTYAFARVEDMFTFFRRGDGYKDRINPDYWSEKLLSVDRSASRRDSDGVKVFCEKKARAAVAQATDGWPGAVRAIAFDQCRGESEDEWRQAVYAFEHTENGETYQISDFWEHDLRVWSRSFLWNLHAIVWGIAKYDEEKAKAPAPAVAP